ncbi:MAG: hypothetical protein FWE43_03000 [Streptococcaceae bacterium]|nr:hypothetical protein [Streptococcaceae bacterium]MCL2681431.1 hypothetical protein [Streptococcaceae bacterium]
MSGNGKIASSTDSAFNAISKFPGQDSFLKDKHVDFTGSNIQGMLDGQKVCNEMLTEISNLSQSTYKQAEKFPELAKKFEVQDKQDATDLASMNWGF